MNYHVNKRKIYIYIYVYINIYKRKCSIFMREEGETLLLSNFPPILNHAFCIKPCQAFKFKDDSTLFLALLISCGKIRKKRRRRKPWNFVIIEYRFSQTLYYYCEGNFASFPQISGHSHLHPHITALPDNFVHLTRCKPRNYIAQHYLATEIIDPRIRYID